MATQMNQVFLPPVVEAAYRQLQEFHRSLTSRVDVVGRDALAIICTLISHTDWSIVAPPCHIRLQVESPVDYFYVEKGEFILVCTSRVNSGASSSFYRGIRWLPEQKWAKEVAVISTLFGTVSKTARAIRKSSFIAELNQSHYLVHTYAICPLLDRIVFAQELFTCDLEELRKHHYTIGQERLSRKYCVRLCLDVAKAVEYLHGENVIHCDIKPANALYSQSEKRACLTDLDFAKKFGERDVDYTECAPVFAAPEVLALIFSRKNECLRAAVDIWALGMFFAQFLELDMIFPLGSIKNPGLLGELTPYIFRRQPPPQELRQRLGRALSSGVDAAQAGSLELLCKDMMRLSPSKRPSIGEVVRRLSAIEKKM